MVEILCLFDDRHDKQTYTTFKVHICSVNIYPACAWLSNWFCQSANALEALCKW